MNIWINKCDSDEIYKEFNEAYTFSISIESSTIYDGIYKIWREISVKPIESIYEDLSIIALSIFSIDKRVSRWYEAKDKWTRDLKVSIPVLNYDKWKDTVNLWNEMLNFLTGDNWNINFRATKNVYGKYYKREKIKEDISKCTAVSLFSGGLDSFCGALNLLDKGKSVCFIGHNEYPKLGDKQKKLKNAIKDEYPLQSVKFFSFTANSQAPEKNNEKLKHNENTCRGRSLLFLSVAISVAGVIGEDIPVYIPENGFIGLNIPLTNNRKGSCSTRTTHPFFIRKYNELLNKIGIKNTIKNFFAYKTKREVVNTVKDNNVFKNYAGSTISCSHPCLPRWNKDENKREYPKNCGYCYPCLIRKSSLLGLNIDEDYTYNRLNSCFLKGDSSNKTKMNDSIALINSAYRYKHIDDNEIRRLIRCTGPLTSEDVEKFLGVYKSTMKDILEMIDNNREIRDYTGIVDNE